MSGHECRSPDKATPDFPAFPAWEVSVRVRVRVRACTRVCTDRACAHSRWVLAGCLAPSRASHAPAPLIPASPLALSLAPPLSWNFKGPCFVAQLFGLTDAMCALLRVRCVGWNLAGLALFVCGYPPLYPPLCHARVCLHVCLCVCMYAHRYCIFMCIYVRTLFDLCEVQDLGSLPPSLAPSSPSSASSP